MPHFLTDDDGQVRMLGNIVPPAGVMRSWPVYGDVPEAPLLTWDQIDAYIAKLPPGPDDPFLPPVADQNGYGMCNASATASAAESCRLLEGLDYVQLSAGDLYGRINGGVDRGSLLEDGLAEAMRGIASAQIVPYLDWRSHHDGAAADRARFRVLEAYLCPTIQHCLSAVCRAFKLISGVMWYSNYKPDAEGWLPSQGRGQSGGHAVFGYKPAKRGNVRGIWHQNSWTASWGLGGRCIFPATAYEGPVGGWWAVRGTTIEPGNIPAPIAKRIEAWPL